MLPTEPRRLVILTEGQFGIHDAKTAMGVIRYGRDDIVAILDSTMAGRNLSESMPGRDIPFVATLAETLAGPDRPDGLLIGIAPTGGKLPREWRPTILEAIGAGLDVHSGLHEFLGDDPEFAAAAERAGTRLIDYRRPPDRMETTVGRRHEPGKRVILTVGTDCAIGKMSVALELVASARRDGVSAVMVPDRPDRDDDRGLGRCRGSRHQRLHERHRRVARRAGRSRAVTGSSSRARDRSTTPPTAP